MDLWDKTIELFRKTLFIVIAIISILRSNDQDKN